MTANETQTSTTAYADELPFIMCPLCHCERGPEEWANVNGHCDDCEFSMQLAAGEAAYDQSVADHYAQLAATDDAADYDWGRE